MAEWTTPRTWATNDFMLASLVKTHIHENSLFLKSRPFGNTIMTASTTTTSTSFVELTQSRVTFTSYGGNVMIGACGIFSNSTIGTTNTFDVAIDGTRQGDATTGIHQITEDGADFGDCFTLVWFTSSAPTAGSHTYSIYWKVSANTGAIYLRMFVLEIR